MTWLEIIGYSICVVLGVCFGGLYIAVVARGIRREYFEYRDWLKRQKATVGFVR